MKIKKKAFDYFDYFCSVADIAVEAAVHLETTLSGYKPEEVEKAVEVMHEIENRADAKKHEMMKSLLHEFLPPVEREDIVTLAHEMDNVIDSVDEVLRRMFMFDVHAIRPETLEFSKLILSACTTLKDAAAELKNFKKSTLLTERLIKINSIESDGDALHFSSMHRLFSSCKDAKELMVWEILFEELENCLDCAEHAADAIETLVMKNS